MSGPEERENKEVMKMKKYEFVDEVKVAFGITLRRIRALISFSDVKAGDLGGFIEKEDNLPQSGDAWVYGDAQVCGNAWVCDNDAIFCISGIGSRGGTSTFFLCKDKKIRVSCGCFFGDLNEFAAKVQKTHGDNRHGEVYRLAIEMAKAHIIIPADEE